MSFLLDSTIGLIIIYMCLKISQILAFRYKWTSLILGEYGMCEIESSTAHLTVKLVVYSKDVNTHRLYF